MMKEQLANKVQNETNSSDAKADKANTIDSYDDRSFDLAHFWRANFRSSIHNN